MKNTFSIFLISLSLSALADNKTCPMNQRSTELQGLFDEAKSSLEGLKTVQQACARDLAAAGGGQQGADQNLTDAIDALGTAEPECPTVSSRVRQRQGLLVRTMTTLQATDATSEDTPIQGRDGSWKKFNYYSSNVPALRPYNDCVEQASNNGVTTFYVNMTCTQTIDDLEVATADPGADAMSLSGGGGQCGRPGVVSERVQRALRTAITTAISLSGNSQCPAAPRAAASLLNLGTALVMSSPISPLAGILVSAGQSLFNSIFMRRTQTAAAAITATEEERMESEAQCLYMNLQRAHLGCENTPRNIEDLQKRVSDKEELEGLIRTKVSEYQTAFSSNPDEDHANCVRQSTATTNQEALRRMITGWNLPAVEALFQAPPASQGSGQITITTSGTVPPRPFEPNLGQIFMAAQSTCAAYQQDETAVSRVPLLSEVSGRLHQLCEKVFSDTVPDLNDYRMAFYGNPEGTGAPLSTIASRQVYRTPRTSGPSDQLLTQCLNAIGGTNPDRRTRMMEVRTLRGRLSAYDTAVADLAEARTIQEQSLLTAEASRNWARYHGVWAGNNSTNVKISDILQQRIGGTTGLAQACQTNSNLDPIIRSANEIHATCLLNAGVYLFRDNAEPDFRSDKAQEWERNCSYFLNDPELAPPVPNPAPMTPATYANWQCEAFRNFDRYRQNFIARRSRVAEICPSISREGRRTAGRVLGQ